VTINMLEQADFNILGQLVRIETDHVEFYRQIRRLLRSFALPSPTTQDKAALTLSVRSEQTDKPDSRMVVCRDDQIVGEGVDGSHSFRLMEWQLDIFLADTVRDVFLLHAGAVAYKGAGVILPGESGSGKSSLTTALILAGYHYLSDELAVIDPVSQQLESFAKPLSIKNTTVFDGQITTNWFGPDAAIIKQASEELPGYVPVWYQHPSDMGATIGTDPVPAHFIIFPTYHPQNAPQLQPLARADAMQRLIENAVNSHHFPANGLHVMARLDENAACYTLVSNDLAESVRLITALVDHRGG
jgi:HprK-related kinase A